MVVVDGILWFIKSSYVGRNIMVYYKYLCWTEYYSLLKMLVIDGILRFITGSCVGQNITLYDK